MRADVKLKSEVVRGGTQRWCSRWGLQLLLQRPLEEAAEGRREGQRWEAGLALHRPQRVMNVWLGAALVWNAGQLIQTALSGMAASRRSWPDCTAPSNQHLLNYMSGSCVQCFPQHCPACVCELQGRLDKGSDLLGRAPWARFLSPL